MVNKNSGVNISGNATVHGGVFGGEKATVIATVTGSGDAPVLKTVDELHAAIVELALQIRGSDLPGSDELAGVADTIANQATDKQPNKTLFKGLLETVRTGVAGITALTKLVSGIEEAAKTLLGIG
jgi:predicted ATPase